MSSSTLTTIRGHQDDKKTSLSKSIVLFSSDYDFCLSLSIFFSNRYRIIMTTDAVMLPLIVKDHRPDLLIADTMLTENMKRRFTMMRKENPNLHIMLFYVSYFGQRLAMDDVHQYVDVMFPKPVDLEEVSQNVRKLIETL
ncbi:MAG TPA: hypothetical protein VFF29_03975 [Bacteroidota bacterium]|nr:hypothetical protein [Bacteroidota bacterium]